ncbi:hypothetical protein [Streptomyces sp. NBC_00154]|uniref:hypothetical protein n=1 Tax=Streptomyces sp. NBC_00154 TaxID=2975670 RepID=UPI00338E3425
MDRSTVTRAVHEIRPLLAARGFAVPGEAGLRLYTLAEWNYARRQGRPTAQHRDLREARPCSP